MRLKLLSGVAAAAILAGVSSASAGVVFDGSSWSGTTDGTNGVTSSTTSGTTTLTNTGASGTNAGSDFVNLSTPITSDSGIWTLTATVNANVPTSGSSADFHLGFANFTDTQTAINNISTTSTAKTPNGAWIADQRANLSNGAGFTAGYHSGGTISNGPLFNIVNPNEPHTGPLTFQIVLNTNAPNWTAEFFLNGVQQTFATTGGQTSGTVNQLIYATNPGPLSEFGISLDGGSVPSSATFSNISLVDQQVQGVPEPSTWAMMVAGFAGLGILSYRRTRRNGGLNFRFA
jgi:hypothetical protein